MTQGEVKPNDPAFPCREAVYAADIGLTKREWFMGRAMQGMLAANDWQWDNPDASAAIALSFADAAIRALSEPTR